LQVIKREDEGNYRYIGRAEIPEMPFEITRSSFSAQLAERVDQWEKKGVPWLFAPAAKFARGLKSEELNKAQSVIYEASVLGPFLNAAGEIMDNQQNGKWTRQNTETKVLQQLIRLKAKTPLNEEGEYSAQTFLDPLFTYIFHRDADDQDKEAFEKRIEMYNEDKANLHQPADLIYGEFLSPTFVVTDPNFLETSIEKGVTLFNAYWSDANQVGTQSQDYAYIDTLEKIGDAFEEFDTAEKSILALRSHFGAGSDKPYADDRWDRFVSDWNKSFESLGKAREIINGCVGRLNNPPSLRKMWVEVAGNTLRDVNDHYQLLINDLETEEAQENNFLKLMRARLEAAYGRITNKLIGSEAEEKLRLIDERFYAQTRDGNHLYEIRFQIYSKCHEQFGQVSPSALSELRGVIQKVDEDIAGARSSVRGLPAVDPTAYRFQEAADICGLAIELAQQRHFYSIVEHSLRSAPKSIKEIGNFIEKQGKWDWTGVPPNIIDRKYDPKVTEDALGGWKALGDTLQHLPKEANLRKEFNDANDIYAEYPKLYFEYWLGKVSESVIKNKVEQDAEQLKNLIVRNVFDELIGDLGGLLEKTVTPLRIYTPQGEERVKQFEDNLAEVEDRRNYEKYYQLCRTVLNNWRELGDNVRSSRESLLRITPADYLEDYAPFSYESPAEFLDMYWTELTLRLLNLLSSQVQQQGREALDNLRTKFGAKFPLERDSTANLTQIELSEAWSSLNRIRLQEAFSKETIGAGAKTGSDEINEQLKLLREVRPTEAYKQWFERIEGIFRCLPQAKDPYYCKITLLSQNEQRKLVEQQEKVLLDYLTEFRLVQGDYKSGRSNTRSSENSSVGIFQYPGSPLSIEFFQYPSDTEKHTSVEFSQPWAPLRMLHQCYDGRKKGYIKLKVESEKSLGGVLFLQLEFFKDNDCKYPVDLPSPDQWPSLKSKE
jgi:hypothetical protein